MHDRGSIILSSFHRCRMLKTASIFISCVLAEHLIIFPFRRPAFIHRRKCHCRLLFFLPFEVENHPIIPLALIGSDVRLTLMSRSSQREQVL